MLQFSKGPVHPSLIRYDAYHSAGRRLGLTSCRVLRSSDSVHSSSGVSSVNSLHLSIGSEFEEGGLSDNLDDALTAGQYRDGGAARGPPANYAA